MKQYKCSMSKKKESLSKKNERGTTKIETYVGFDELLEYADAEYLLEDVVDVLSKYYTYEDETFDEDQAKDDPEFTIKIEGGDERADYYYENVFYVHLPSKEAAEELAKVLGGKLSESKKPESKKSESDTADAEQVFKDMADSLGISDRSVITTDGDKIKFVLKLKLKDLEDYAWEYNPKLKVVKNIASPTADAFDGAKKTVNTVEDAAAWLKGGIEELLNMEKEAIDLVGNESKKSEGISDMIDAKIDYNMFMRMCKTAAYLEEDEDYWDALWEYFSEVGSIGDALVFFDNLFQYTAWKTAKELWSDFSDILGDKPEDKDYEEALDAYLDENDNEVGNAVAFKYGDHYLMIY